MLAPDQFSRSLLELFGPKLTEAGSSALDVVVERSRKVVGRQTLG